MTTWRGPDSLRAVLDSVFAAPKYRWTTRPDPFAIVHRWWQELGAWFDRMQETHPLGYQAVLIVLVVILFAVVAHAAWVFIQTVRSTPASAAPAVTRGERRDQWWYRREADRLAADGRFAEAMQADFVALVLALDASQVLHFHPSKTPAEYAREFPLPPEARSDFRELVGRLYGYAFARWPCGPREFAEWRERAVAERYAPAH